MTDWKNWSRGVVGAAINMSVNSLAVIIVDHSIFDTSEGLIKLAKLAVVSGLIGAVLWMKQHENPWFQMSVGGGGK
jgi:hypothetical protein